MKHAAGYGAWTDASGKVTQELDTVQCQHCQNHIFVKPATFSTVYLIWDKRAWRWREEPGAWCRVCDGPVCLACHESNDGRCQHFLRQIERAENETARRDALARLGRS